MKKVCSECKNEKDIEEFQWKSKKQGRRQSQCIVCHGQYQRDYYEKNKIKVKEKIYSLKKIRKERIRAYLNSLKEKGCERCQEKRLPVLQFHHLDPNYKEINLSDCISADWNIKRIENEVSKCIILCSNCHFMEHYTQRNI